MAMYAAFLLFIRRVEAEPLNPKPDPLNPNSPLGPRHPRAPGRSWELLHPSVPGTTGSHDVPKYVVALAE
jgi:hypothetical protein